MIMKEILETIQLSNNKSSYLIELIGHDSGVKYVKIEHILGQERSTININPKNLTDIIVVLNNYKTKIDRNLTLVKNNDEKIPNEIKEKADLIQNRYLKGVSIKDLAMQFDCEENLILMILENREIEIVSNKMSKNLYWMKKRNRKK